MASVPQDLAAGPDYAWEIATVFPMQGAWSEGEFLYTFESTNRRVEFVDGHLEFPTMPTTRHQDVCNFLFLSLHKFASEKSPGHVYQSGIRVRVRANKIRLPDIVYVRAENDHLMGNDVWQGADLAMEIVSDDPNDQKRDYETKLIDYAEASISEYWIVDPQQRIIQVHKLDGDKYALHGQFAEGDTATSVLLEGFTVDVRSLFAVMMDLSE